MLIKSSNKVGMEDGCYVIDFLPRKHKDAINRREEKERN